MKPPSQHESNDRLTVEISKDLEDIVPIFLGNRDQDLRTLRAALTRQDFGTIQSIGHRLKGDGGGYGFDRISEIGAAMEQVAKLQEHRMAEQHILELEDYLRRIHIIYR